MWSDEFNEPAGTPPNPENWGYEIGDGTVNGIPGWKGAQSVCETNIADAETLKTRLRPLCDKLASRLREKALAGRYAIERELGEGSATCICSLSSKTIVYKGLLLAPQIEEFYQDLANPAVVSAIALVHQRFSTNTLPEWRLAQPFRFLAHNGEINSVNANRDWANARGAIPDMDQGLSAGDVVRVGKTVELEALDTPGHTMSHVCLLSRTDAPALFCGDTLFAGGCGRVFEGTHPMMHASLQRLAALPPATRVYCAHEYTLANAGFALSIDPDNPALPVDDTIDFTPGVNATVMDGAVIGDDGFAPAPHDRPRFADPVSRFGGFFRQPVENLGFAPATEQFDGGLVGDQKMVFAQRPRVAVDIALADVPNALGVVRPEPRIDERDSAVMLAHAVAWRPGDNELRTRGDRQHGNHQGRDHGSGRQGFSQLQHLLPEQ